MQRRFLPIIAGAFFSVSFLNLSCNKLDTTDIGSDLIPPVDNVSTFETTLNINTTQGIFNDSTVLASTDEHVVGSISQDPVFGKTNADLFVELKPSFYPFYWGNPNDTVNVSGTGLDSVVLCLSFKGYYGDSTVPQTLKVFQIANSVTDFKDSGYQIHNYYPALGAQIGSAVIDPRRVNDIIHFRNNVDSASSQIRIPLSAGFANSLFSQDSTGNNAFVNDSLFRTKFKGFAVVADSSAGEGLFYVNLSDATTRLEVHFRRRNAGKIDTTFTTLTFSTGATTDIAYSARANYVNRNRATAEYNPPSSNGAADALYLQTTPGTYVNLHIPQLDTLSNRIIHRAEIIVEQIFPDLKSNVLAPPNYLYIDAIDTANLRWRPLPYDLSPNEAYSYYPSTGGIDFTYFGGYLRHKKNLVGADIGFYNFNISRYVQNMVTRGRTTNRNYDLRLYAPFEISYPDYLFSSIAFSNSLAYGRVKVGSGTNANYRLRLHIIYSKI
ncbi:MAG: DUF4270 family protein [Ferruginibacter sp.]